MHTLYSCVCLYDKFLSNYLARLAVWFGVAGPNQPTTGTSYSICIYIHNPLYPSPSAEAAALVVRSVNTRVKIGIPLGVKGKSNVTTV